MKIPGTNKEMSYLELLFALRKDIKSDTTIPSEEKADVLKALISLELALWPYSA